MPQNILQQQSMFSNSMFSRMLAPLLAQMMRPQQRTQPMPAQEQTGGLLSGLLGAISNLTGELGSKNIPGISEAEPGSQGGILASLLGMSADPWLRRIIHNVAPLAGGIAGNIFLPGFGGAAGSMAGRMGAGLLFGPKKVR